MSGRQDFDNELEQLHIELIKMGGVVEQAIEKSIEALEKQDQKLADSIIRKDRIIDDMEKQIERKCLSLILRQQPVARDLRNVSTALKMVTDLERIGDHASDISELILRIKDRHAFNFVAHIPEMAVVSKKMVHDAITSFVNGNVDEAKRIAQEDDKIDGLFNKVKLEVVQILSEGTDKIDLCIDFLMIAKYFERIGDHAENICEWVEFSETGEYKNERII